MNIAATWKYTPQPARLSVDRVALVKDRLTMPEVAERYGFEVVRGTIVCPFHNDTRPSCYVYPGQRGFYCFACGTGGDVIVFVAKLFGLEYTEAAARLDTDFAMGIGDGPVDDTAIKRWKEKRAKDEAEKAAKHEKWLELIDEIRAIRRLPKPETIEQGQLYSVQLARLDYLEYLAEQLSRQM